jgi:hypothetical protein
MAEAEAEAVTEVKESEDEKELFGSTLADALGGTCYIVYMLSVNPCKCQVDEVESFKQHIQGVNAPEDLKPALSELAKRLDKVISDLKSENISLEDIRMLIEWCYLTSESFIPQIVVEHALEIKGEVKPQGQG